MNLRKYLIKYFLIFFFTISFAEKTFSLEPDKFIQSIADEASNILVENFSKDEKWKS